MILKKDSPVYSHWRDMKGRCYRKNSKQFNDYGGRGIKVCNRWLSDFWQFHNDMFPTYQKGLSLDRIDNNKDYYPENCQWSTKKEQQRNQRRTNKVIIEGKEYKVIELSELSGIKTDVIKRRVELGLTLEQILKKGRLYTNLVAKEKLKLRAAKAALTRKNKPTCNKGHLWDKNNTGLYKNGTRYCKACRKLLGY